MFLIYFVYLYLIDTKINKIKVIDTYKNEINFVTLTKFDIVLNLFTLYKNYYMFIASFFE
jgi:hypothetical protein